MVRQTVDEELVHERMQPAKSDSFPATLGPPPQHNGLSLTPRSPTLFFMNTKAAEHEAQDPRPEVQVDGVVNLDGFARNTRLHGVGRQP